MKNLFNLTLLSLIVMISCKKNDELNSYLTISTGDSYSTCYQKIQDLYGSGQVIALAVDNVSINSIDNMDEKLALYTEFLLVEKNVTSSADTISFSFQSDTLQHMANLNRISILTGAPEGIDEWPENAESQNKIKRGDNKQEINEKFILLAQEGTLENYMSSIRFTQKDLETVHDPDSENSAQWNVMEVYNDNDMKLYGFSLHFANGRVQKIERLEIPQYFYN